MSWETTKYRFLRDPEFSEAAANWQPILLNKFREARDSKPFAETESYSYHYRTSFIKLGRAGGGDRYAFYEGGIQYYTRDKTEYTSELVRYDKKKGTFTGLSHIDKKYLTQPFLGFLDRFDDLYVNTTTHAPRLSLKHISEWHPKLRSISERVSDNAVTLSLQSWLEVRQVLRNTKLKDLITCTFKRNPGGTSLNNLESLIFTNPECLEQPLSTFYDAQVPQIPSPDQIQKTTLTREQISSMKCFSHFTFVSQLLGLTVPDTLQISRLYLEVIRGANYHGIASEFDYLLKRLSSPRTFFALLLERQHIKIQRDTSDAYQLPVDWFLFFPDSFWMGLTWGQIIYLNQLHLADSPKLSVDLTKSPVQIAELSRPKYEEVNDYTAYTSNPDFLSEPVLGPTLVQLI